MNKVLKKVLIYLGVGTFGAMVGIGALIGVSSCSYKQENNTQQKAKAQPKRKKITFGESDLNNDNTYYFVVKNYENNGLGALWRQLGQGQDFSTADIDNAMPYPDITFLNVSSFEFRFYTDYTSLTGFNRLQFLFTEYLGSNILQYVIFYNNDYTQQAYLFYVSESNAYFNKNYACFTASNINMSVGDNFFAFINTIFDIYKLDSQVYTMSAQINYYMPYTQNIETGLVFDNSVLSAEWVKRYTLIENKPFYSNGFVFDTIKLVYRNAYNKVFIIYDNVKKLITDSTGIAYYSEMVYENSVTGLSVVVNNRDYAAATDNNNLIMLYQRSSNWVNTSYRVLKFFDTPFTSQFEALNNFNNLAYGSDWYADNNVSTDVGLGAVFGLITTAFSSMVPLFAIQIVPGITIGLLLFLPLIAGVIVLIIWVVKR